MNGDGTGDERWQRGAERIRELSGPDALERVEQATRGAAAQGGWVVELQ
jgi:hypothetical protein